METSKSVFIENGNNSQKIYNSMTVDPEKLSIFSNELALKIIKELATSPSCAMDLARKLGQHEQKIYYHLRKMIDAGIVELTRSEARYGMTAKIYSVVSPVISAKLDHNDFKTASQKALRNQRFLDFMYPFIKDGELNAKIIIGDPYSHGRFDAAATESPHLFDLAILLGTYLDDLNFPFYKLDTEVKESDLKENIILFGNPRTNTVVDSINENGNRFFEQESYILSLDKNRIHRDPRIGLIVKEINPFNKHKKMLIIGGVRSRGLKAAIIAMTQNLDRLMVNYDKHDNFTRIIQGVDRSGNKVIDAFKIVE